MNYKWELLLPSCVSTPFPCTLPCSTPSTSLVPLPGAVIPIETGGCWAISVQPTIQPAFLRFRDGYRCKTSNETARCLSSLSNRKDVMDQQWQSSAHTVSTVVGFAWRMSKSLKCWWSEMCHLYKNVSTIWIPSSCNFVTYQFDQAYWDNCNSQIIPVQIGADVKKFFHFPPFCVVNDG